MKCLHVAWFGIFHGWRSLSSSFAWKEASHGFRHADDMTVDVNIRGKWQLLRLGIPLHHGGWDCCVKRWLLVPQRYSNRGFCSLTLLHYFLIRDKIKWKKCDKKYNRILLKPSNLICPLTIKSYRLWQWINASIFRTGSKIYNPMNGSLTSPTKFGVKCQQHNWSPACRYFDIPYNF